MKTFIIGVVLSLFLGALGCNSAQGSKVKLGSKENMTGSEAAFEKVVIDSLEKNECSPEAPREPSFRGILIRTPKVVRFEPGVSRDRHGSFATVPICGFYQLDLLLPDKFESLQDAIALVATDTKTGRQYRGRMVSTDPLVPAPEPTPRPKMDSYRKGKIVYSGYFNPNLAIYAGLPATAAEYEVYVELAESEVKSNTVVLRIEQVGLGLK